MRVVPAGLEAEPLARVVAEPDPDGVAAIGVAIDVMVKDSIAALLSAAMAPDEVAARVVDAIRDEASRVLPHSGWDGFIVAREAHRRPR